MSSPPTEMFTRRLRDATKSIHDVSDHMVNLKLGVAMSDDSVWAEGLLVFYEVFRFLEGAVQRTKDSLLGEYNLIAGLWRTEVKLKLPCWLSLMGHVLKLASATGPRAGPLLFPGKRLEWSQLRDQARGGEIFDEAQGRRG